MPHVDAGTSQCGGLSKWCCRDNNQGIGQKQLGMGRPKNKPTRRWLGLKVIERLVNLYVCFRGGTGESDCFWNLPWPHIMAPSADRV